MQDLFRHLRIHVGGERRVENETKSARRCKRCGSDKEPVEVHGHTQCADCKCVQEDCCQGECATE